MEMPVHDENCRPLATMIRTCGDMTRMKLAVIGVPFNSAGTNTAEALAPQVLREVGLVEALSRGSDVVDYGDVEYDAAKLASRDKESGIIAPKSLMSMIAAVRGAVARAYDEGRMPVVIGGDCALLLGGLLAARDQLGYGPALLFVDGHEDSYEPRKSMNGEAADMELGLATGFTTVKGLPELADELPIVDPHQVVLIGARDSDEVETEGHKSIGTRVIVLDDTELRAAGVESTILRWLEQFQHKPGRFWFHLDWDVLSSDEMPAVSYPQPGGLVWAEVETIARAALHADHLIGVDTTLYNPRLDPKRTAARKIVDFLAEVTAAPEREPRLGRI
jgi:arginase